MTLLAGLPPGYQPDFFAVDPADAPDVVATHIAEVVRRAIASESDVDRRVELTNDLLAMLAVPDEQLPGAVEHLSAQSKGHVWISRNLFATIASL